MIQMQFIFYLTIIAAVIISSNGWGQKNEILPYQNSNLNNEKRVEDLLARMTLEEKAEMVSGTGFDSKPHPRLGIPALQMTDGPVGIRGGQATAFPVSVAMAASWDPELVYEIGQALGREAKAKSRNVLLAPCVNIHRLPHGGRNFESFGEDPFLASRMAVAYIRGVQSEKVIATAKHFACNNQEFERMSIDVRMAERTLHEIYLPAFKAAVQEAGVWAIMSAYNRLNGHYCSDNTYLLTDILKNEWGFQGFVMSDWGAVHSIIPTLYAGLDIEMPSARYLTAAEVMAAVTEGTIKMSKLDDKIRRMLRAIFAMGYFDPSSPDAGALHTAAHQSLARKVAQNSIVLLKNERNLLPLDRKQIRSIAVIGPNAAEAVTGGGGSSRVQPFYAISPLEGLQKVAGNDITIGYARGLSPKLELQPIESIYLKPPDSVEGDQGLLAEYFDNMDFQGEAVLRRIDRQINFNIEDGPIDAQIPKDNFSIRWTGKLVPKESGRYALGIGSDDGTRLYLNGELVVNNWGQHAIVTKSDTIDLEAGTAYDLMIEFFENAGGAAAILGWLRLDDPSVQNAILLEKQRALDLARSSDVVVLCLGNNDKMESEGFDRDQISLPEGQTELLLEVAAVNPKTIVVLNSGAAVLMSEWIDKIPALLAAWFPGQEGGNALADILFGVVNPSAKLPTTFLKNWQDSPAYGNYPGKDGIVNYAEGIFVGYRHFDRLNIAPLFPFGYGLSYTTFALNDLKISHKTPGINDKITVSLKVKNTGSRAGAEVVQLYLGDADASVERPVKELKGFQKVTLQPGEDKTVTFILDHKALAFWDVSQKDWMAEPGLFKVMVGTSAQDLKLLGEFELK